MTSNYGACVAAALTVLCSLSVSRADVFTDNFDDNSTGSTWRYTATDDARLSLREQNGRVEVLASAIGKPTIPLWEAWYVSDGPMGFYISTANDFAVAIDYADALGLSGGTDVSLGLSIGIAAGSDLDDYAVTSVGTSQGGTRLFAPTFKLGGDVQFFLPPTFTGPPRVDSGVVSLSYVAAIDTLTFSGAGASISYSGLVDGAWATDRVLLMLGARGDQFVSDGSLVGLDNVRVVSGTVIPIPEPAAIGVFSGSLLLIRRRRNG